jgi:hypothetical protein
VALFHSAPAHLRRGQTLTGAGAQPQRSVTNTRSLRHCESTGGPFHCVPNCTSTQPLRPSPFLRNLLAPFSFHEFLHNGERGHSLLHLLQNKREKPTYISHRIRLPITAVGGPGIKVFFQREPCSARSRMPSTTLSVRLPSSSPRRVLLCSALRKLPAHVVPPWPWVAGSRQQRSCDVHHAATPQQPQRLLRRGCRNRKEKAS